MKYITRTRDCDLYLLKYLTIYDIILLMHVNKSIYELIINSEIIQFFKTSILKNKFFDKFFQKKIYERVRILL